MPRAAAGWRWGFDELARRHGDFALAGLAARCEAQPKASRRMAVRSRLVFFGVGTRPVRARRAEAALAGRRADAEALAAAGPARSTTTWIRPATCTARPLCAGIWRACCSRAS